MTSRAAFLVLAQAWAFLKALVRSFFWRPAMPPRARAARPGRQKGWLEVLSDEDKTEEAVRQLIAKLEAPLTKDEELGFSCEHPGTTGPEIAVSVCCPVPRARLLTRARSRRNSAT